MTRREYLDELNTHLMSLPAEERENAVNFYEEYFEDAGVENEQEVINELGKPYALAKSIICEESAYSKSLSYAQYRASKLMNSTQNELDIEIDNTPDIMPNTEEDSQPHIQYTTYDKEPAAEDNSYEAYKEAYTGSGNTSYANTSSSSSSNTVSIIIAIIIGIPALIILICIFAGLAFASLGCLLATLIVAVASGMGIFGFGISLLCVGIGLILSVPAVIGFGKIVPALGKAIIKTFKTNGGESI